MLSYSTEGAQNPGNSANMVLIVRQREESVAPWLTSSPTLFDDVTRDSIANNFIIDVYCTCLQNSYQIAFFYKI